MVIIPPMRRFELLAIGISCRYWHRTTGYRQRLSISATRGSELPDLGIGIKLAVIGSGCHTAHKRLQIMAWNYQLLTTTDFELAAIIIGHEKRRIIGYRYHYLHHPWEALYYRSSVSVPISAPQLESQRGSRQVDVWVEFSHTSVLLAAQTIPNHQSSQNATSSMSLVWEKMCVQRCPCNWKHLIYANVQKEFN